MREQEQKITADQMRTLKTLITNFMNDESVNLRTFGELVEIFNNRYKSFNPDPSNDLRICCYTEDMKEGKWDGDISLKLKNGIVTDGVHRGIAYLRCIDKGIKESDLPNVFINEV